MVASLPTQTSPPLPILCGGGSREREKEREGGGGEFEDRKGGKEYHAVSTRLTEHRCFRLLELGTNPQHTVLRSLQPGYPNTNPYANGINTFDLGNTAFRWPFEVLVADRYHRRGAALSVENPIGSVGLLRSEANEIFTTYRGLFSNVKDASLVLPPSGRLSPTSPSIFL